MRYPTKKGAALSGVKQEEHGKFVRDILKDKNEAKQVEQEAED